jgi:lipopolysaccharide transport system ATP-binding protein
VDTPVKRYSSGMHVRLAFAVAAHLEPEILLVDEVLAVGDAAFRQRCIGRMNEVARSGRTVVFVSHNMAAVESLCAKSILLEEGRIVREGDTGDVLQEYLGRQFAVTAGPDVTESPHRLAGMKPVARRFEIRDHEDRATQCISLGESMTFDLELASDGLLRDVVVGIHIYNIMGQRVATCHTTHQYGGRIDVEGRVRLTCRLNRCDLLPGTYAVVLGVAAGRETVDRIDPVTSFEVTPRDVYGTGRLPAPRDGVIAPDAQWTVGNSQDSFGVPVS